MTMRNLNRDQNLEMARLLIGAGKTIFVASIVAILFPQSGIDRPFLLSILGVGLSAILAAIGLALIKGQDADPQAGRRKRR
ncbi:MAG: hypothetical protein AAB152_07305 [Candidatus Coatesbacteria bacterium]